MFFFNKIVCYLKLGLFGRKVYIFLGFVFSLESGVVLFIKKLGCCFFVFYELFGFYI